LERELELDRQKQIEEIQRVYGGLNELSRQQVEALQPQEQKLGEVREMQQDA